MQGLTKSPHAKRSRRKFLRLFPQGFKDGQYLQWERNYKWNAHLEWEGELNRDAYRSLLRAGQYREIAARAIRIESRTNLLFSFEKMALRDAVKSIRGAQLFTKGLFDFLYGPGTPAGRFEGWCHAVARLPRKQTRVLTWPVVTVFGFMAQPKTHIFLKPNAMRAAARLCGATFTYEPRPSWESYTSFLEFVRAMRRDIQDLRPRDMIDLQSFLWVVGSDEYAGE